MSKRLHSASTAMFLICAILAMGSGCAITQPFDPEKIPSPQIPDRTFNIKDYGAVGDGKTLNTEAISKAIDACRQAGGGKVLVPAGRYLTGPLKLCSNLNLHLEKDATLLAINEIDFYPLYPNPTPKLGYVYWITADDPSHDIAITGEGTLDGQGQTWWEKYKKHRDPRRPEPSEILPHRPHLIVIKNCERLLVQGVTLTNSPMFHLIPESCTNVVIRDIKIIAPDEATNTDGIDPSGWNIYITNCYIDTGDDDIAIKPAARPGKWGRPAVENVVITNCTFVHGHGLSIGGQTNNGLRNLVIRDCTWIGTEHGIRFKANRKAGGLVENITAENLTMKGVLIPLLLYSYYSDKALTTALEDKPQKVTKTTPIWRNVTIKNLTADNAKTASRIIGLPEMPISNVLLENVKISGGKSFDIFYASKIKFVNSSVTTEAQPPVNVQKAEVTGIDPQTGK